MRTKKFIVMMLFLAGTLALAQVSYVGDPTLIIESDSVFIVRGGD